MKYIIDIPDKADYITAVYMDNGLPVAYKSDRLEDLEPYTEPDREAIENEVWHFAGILMDGCNKNERRELTSGNSIFFDTYREVKARYDAKMSKHCKIKVGDECMYDSNKCVVTYVDPDNDCRVEVMFDNGTTYFDVDICNLTPTDKHYPQLEEIIKQMRGE